MDGVGVVAEQLRQDLQLLDASTKEAASLLDLASWQLGELSRQAFPMTHKTMALAKAKENIVAAKARAEEVLEHLDASRKMQGIISAGPRANLDAFLAALAKLEAAIDFLQAHRSMQSAEDALRHTSALRDSALAACSSEFASLLQKHSVVPQALLAAQVRRGSSDGSSGSGGRAGGGGGGPAVEAFAAAAALAASTAPLDLLPESVLPKLKALAAAMLQGGAGGRGCIKTYVDARRSVMQKALDGYLSPLAVSRDELARLSWQQLEAKIPGWVAALRLFVRLAQEEARLCAALFPATEQMAVFSQVTASGSGAIVDCASAVLDARRIPDKLFGMLDMHGAADAALPLLKSAVLALEGPSRLERGPAAEAGGSGSGRQQPEAVAQLTKLRSRLTDEARACFGELQDSLARDGPRSFPGDGTVHPLCATTLSLLKRALGYESALPVLFGDAAASTARGGSSLAEEARLLERMAAAAGRIFDTLLAAVESKGKLAYRSPALAALHQMNNVQYVVRAVEGSKELKAVGEGWVEHNKGKVEAYQQQYVELSWGRLLSLLQQDARQPVPANLASDRAARQVIKDKWSAVNKVLAEAQAQQGWAVPDSSLRFAVKDALADALVPLYEDFCAKYQRVSYSDNRKKYELHSPADLQLLLNELFERAEAGAPGGRVGSVTASGGSSSFLGRKLSSTMSRRISTKGTP